MTITNSNNYNQIYIGKVHLYSATTAWTVQPIDCMPALSVTQKAALQLQYAACGTNICVICVCLLQDISPLWRCHHRQSQRTAQSADQACSSPTKWSPVSHSTALFSMHCVVCLYCTLCTIMMIIIIIVNQHIILLNQISCYAAET